MTDRLGEVLEGKYRLVRLLGTGGMGEVYEAEHTVINRTVAVKLLHADHAQDELSSGRFLREAQAASSIKHRNILEIQDVGNSEDGAIFIVMELLEGRSLADLIRTEAPLSPKKAIAIILEVLEGLTAAHDSGIVHRDLKPDNIFLADMGGGRERVKIVDFGISKVLESNKADGESSTVDEANLTTTGVAIGTPYYMAPEQIRDSKEVDERIDLWAVGVILYQLLTNELPFHASSASELLAKILIDPAPKLTEAEGVPSSLALIVDKALSKSRGDRHQTTSELIKALRQCHSTSSGSSASPPELEATIAGDTSDINDQRSVLEAVEAPPDPNTRTVPEAGLSAQEVLADRTPFASTGVEHGELNRPAEEPEQYRAPLWKRALWYVLMGPIIGAPLLSSLNRPDWIFTALGLPDTLPVAVAWVITIALCTGFLVATIRIERYWRGDKESWLHGRYFFTLPALGLLLGMWHYITLQGQTASYWLTLRSYMDLDVHQAQELSSLISQSTDRFLIATALDLLCVGALAFIVLIGFLFLPRRTARSPRRRTRWLLLPVGLALILFFHTLLFAEALAFMGIFSYLLYLVWMLTTITVLKMEPSRSTDAALGIGVTVAVALTGSQIASGYVQLAEMLITSSVEELPPGDREWIYNSSINPNMIRGMIVEWAILTALFIATFVVSGRLKGMTGGDWRRLLPRVGIIGFTALPLALVFVVADEASSQWAALKVASMEPGSVVAGGPRSFYIDRHPQSLYAGRRGLLAALTEQERNIREDVTEQLSQQLSGRSGCETILVAALRDDDQSEPARCVTAIEARLYCEGLGKRLPTPEEWDAIIQPLEVFSSLQRDEGEQSEGSVSRRPFGEWTMRMVHGTPTFEVRGANASPDGFSSIARLAPDEYSPHVGFRCAWSLD